MSISSEPIANDLAVARGEPAGDWADHLAHEILTDVLSGARDVVGLIAARLRLSRHEGVLEGVELVLDAVRSRP